MDLTRFQSLDVVLICGLQGAGKSHFAKTYLSEGGRKRINRKEIRRLLYEMMNFGEAWKEEYFNEQDEAVKWMIRNVITEAHNAGAKVGLCGQAPSDHPEFAEFLVGCGIDSLSVSPDSFVAVKRHVAAADRRIH